MIYAIRYFNLKCLMSFVDFLSQLFHPNYDWSSIVRLISIKLILMSHKPIDLIKFMLILKSLQFIILQLNGFL